MLARLRSASSASQPQAWLREAGLPKCCAARDHGVHHPLVARVGGAVVVHGKCGDREMRVRVVSMGINQDLEKALPRANTELGALMRTGLATGVAEMAA